MESKRLSFVAAYSVFSWRDASELIKVLALTLSCPYILQQTNGTENFPGATGTLEITRLAKR